MGKTTFTVSLYDDEGYISANIQLRLIFLLAAFMTLYEFIFLSLSPWVCMLLNHIKIPTNMLTENEF